MADLLECLIQIKALSETVTLSVSASASAVPAETESVTVLGLWRRMAEAERRYAAALGAASASAAPTDASPPDAAASRDAFLRLRIANLTMLECCTAAQLAGPVEWPGRRGTTVADLVAIMLASDTERLGDLRRACRRREGDGSTPESGTPTPESGRQAPLP